MKKNKIFLKMNKQFKKRLKFLFCWMFKKTNKIHKLTAPKG